MWHASSASWAADTCSRRWACRARSRPTVNAPDEPSPVPAGMSAMLTISLASPMGSRRNASRTSGCSMSSMSSARSSAEYFTT